MHDINRLVDILVRMRGVTLHGVCVALLVVLVMVVCGGVLRSFVVNAVRALRRTQRRVEPVSDGDHHDQVESFHRSRPRCPVCNRVMAARNARHGRALGDWFWGCSAYPDCHGTREIDGCGG